MALVAFDKVTKTIADIFTKQHYTNSGIDFYRQHWQGKPHILSIK